MAARARSRSRPRRRIPLRWLALGALVVVGFLYYHPIRSYVATRAELASRRAQVQSLAARKRALERRLAAATSREALAVESRKLGYVRPGERLYIVKGIKAWLEHRHTIREGGGR
jgi:cell division protein FtsB